MGEKMTVLMKLAELAFLCFTERIKAIRNFELANINKIKESLVASGIGLEKK